ncbi:Sodium-dependent dicarboxylate transporter SdcS [Pseudobythopirellula maris]|uniref:Sodium-dependent dicarboxylate transporter SdcS n=1 Tax=Pseudobythopirellula maris TaxID=2527991 RepID=A0A5C5ZWF3_9BACT|nr:DASS family sodium-coupled anion symporter [Pseudobythopirellula maris]TWT90583.1 Sodium-dependent dicarboxylate transporter SdcS [Pseudobythopirellula maris]
MNNDTRREARELLGLFRFSQAKTLGLIILSLLAASAAALLPEHAGLEPAPRWALFILVFCAGMWVTEAIPAFATSLLAIGLLIAILGRPGGVFAEGTHDWEMFIQPWGSPLIWLFFGGFCLASSAELTGLDRRLASVGLGYFGNRPATVLCGLMAVTAVLSMFMSNTATATLVMAMLTPVIAARPPNDLISRSLVMGVAFGANLGGMGTIIGTPPNAIAAGLLKGEVNFAQWMVLAVPPALLLLALAWGYLVLVYLRGEAFRHQTELSFAMAPRADVAVTKQRIVIATFVATILMWVTGPLHGVPTTVTSFIPICVLTATGVLGANDIRRIPWDILLLIAGGLALGVAMDRTGLAAWAVERMPIEGLAPAAIAVGFGYAALVMSNLMSNTATANLVLPITVAIFSASDTRLCVPVALCASAAMCLPISTPPNAIVYGSGQLSTKELIAGGALVGVVAPLVTVGWVRLALGWI